MENWKPVFEFEGHYEVSDQGNVRSVDRYIRHPQGPQFKQGITLNPNVAHGYSTINLYLNGHVSHKRVSRLVLEAFVGICPTDMECRHMDGNKLNNNLVNLQWGTKIENADDRVRHGTDPIGSRNPFAVLTEDIVKNIRNDLYAGSSLSDTAKYGVSRSNIVMIKMRKTWRHVS